MADPVADPVDALTVQWEEGGELRVQELAKHVLSRGSWATVLFLFQERDGRTGEMRPPKVSLRRYQKRKGGYAFHSKFTISSAAQGREIARVLQEWCGAAGEDSAAAAGAPFLEEEE